MRRFFDIFSLILILKRIEMIKFKPKVKIREFWAKKSPQKRRFGQF